MKTAKQTIILLTMAVFGLTMCKQKQATEIREDFKKYYDQYNVDGSFVLYDPQIDKYIFYNKEQFEQLFSPASTFKILNSLIGLETGVIADENFVIPWDSVIRQNPNWNTNHNLKSAFKYSTVWYYQELARRVGGQQMKYWLDKAKYGNADTSGGIDKFWLTGGLRISPKQQIDLLKRLHDNQLPFSQRSMDVVKTIMIAKDTLGYVVRAKTGWDGKDDKDVGWYVGYLEKKDKVYYFANCIQSTDLKNKHFANARIDIVYLILNDLKLIAK
jgi:beta-lactamase class D